jgi:hypothetical protein
MRTHRFKFLVATLLVAVIDFFRTLIHHRTIIDNLQNELLKPYEIRLAGIKQRIAGEVDFGLESPLLRDFVGMLIKVYKKQEGAYNYFSLFANDAEFGEPFEIVIQRKLGKTPSQLAGELKEQVANLKANTIQPEELNGFIHWAIKNDWVYVESESLYKQDGWKSRTPAELFEYYKTKNTK